MELNLFFTSYIGVILSFIWGAIWGSFINVVIYRLPKGESILWPPSHCTNCNHSLGAKDNIPILSYVFLRGKCAYCKAPFSPRYAIIEILTAILSLFLYLNSDLYIIGYSPIHLIAFLSDFVFVLVLISLSGIDWDTFILPDIIIIPSIILFIGINFFLHRISIKESLLGAIFGYLFIFLVSFAYKIFKKQEGMGMGDAKLLALLLSYLGIFSLPSVIFLAAIQGLIFAGIAFIFKLSWPNPKPYKGITDDITNDEIYLMLENNKKWQLKPLPFGPFLSLAAIEILFLGNILIKFLSY